MVLELVHLLFFFFFFFLKFNLLSFIEVYVHTIKFLVLSVQFKYF